jgi:hypothetical protein
MNIVAIDIFERGLNRHFKDIVLAPLYHGKIFRALLTEEKHELLPLSDGSTSPTLKRDISLDGKGIAVGFLEIFEDSLAVNHVNC